jgi:hypothetical protein
MMTAIAQSQTNEVSTQKTQPLMKIISLASMAFALLLVSFCSQSEIKKTLGDWDVHYIAFTTTFLSPDIARKNNIVRSGKNALVNISVLNSRSQKAQEVEMSGTARNLLGTTKTLTFKKVTEGDAIYYLATVPFSHKEVLRFDINIEQGKTSQNLKFQQTMYVEE